MNETIETLKAAANRGDAAVIRDLIDRGLNLRDYPKAAGEAFYRAFLSRHHEITQLLVENGVDVDTHDRNGVGLIHWMAFGGQVDDLRLLLDLGADVNARSQDGSTALHWAAVEGQVHAARYLVSKGADIHAALGEEGETVTYRAARNNHPDLLAYLINAGGTLSDDEYARLKQEKSVQQVTMDVIGAFRSADELSALDLEPPESPENSSGNSSGNASEEDDLDESDLLNIKNSKTRLWSGLSCKSGSIHEPDSDEEAPSNESSSRLGVSFPGSCPESESGIRSKIRL